MDKIRLLLVDDHAVLRAGLRFLLNAQPDMEVVGEASDGVEAARLAEELRPDVVLMDLTMPGGGGIEATRKVREACPETKVLVLTMQDDAGYVREALAAGASGFVLKQAADNDLLSAIRTVHASRTMVFAGPSFGSGQTPSWLTGGREGAKPSGLALLTEREKEVVRLLALGHTNQEVAELLYISVKTVDSHRTRIMEKLGLSRRAELVRFALENGLVSLPGSPNR